MIVAIEGVDGAGKHTLTRRLADDLRRRGKSVATASFPRYELAPLGPVIRRMLAGDEAFAEVAASPQASALLFALDRAAAADRLTELARDHDVLLVDRYVASNAAYGAARTVPARQREILAWVAAVEVGELGVLAPDLQVLVRVPVATAASRVVQRSAAAGGDRHVDAYERDDGLQERSAWWYERLARANWLSEWFVLDDSRETYEPHESHEPHEPHQPGGGGGGYDRLLDWLLERLPVT